MTIEPSLDDRVLETFLKQLEGSGSVPRALLSRLSALLSKGGHLTAEEFLAIIQESSIDDATT